VYREDTNEREREKLGRLLSAGRVLERERENGRERAREREREREGGGGWGRETYDREDNDARM